nr:amine oxidase [Acidobacteriota bacterium]
MSTNFESVSPGVVAPTLQAALRAPDLFRSFWVGGYESASHINGAGERLDMIASVQHDTQVEHDYALLRSMGMQTARDGIRWHLIDRGGRYDFSSFAPMLAAAQRHAVQVIWDICHYGWPDDIDLFSPAFVDRFAKFSAAVARFVADRSHEIPFYAPMNEISFFAWGAARGFMFPFAAGRDAEIKEQLVRATVASCEAIWAVDPRARFVYPEPIMHVVPPRGRPDLAAKAAQDTESQFEAWDMLAGRVAPRLGGNPKYLDILGANFYYSNQWEVEGKGRLKWEESPRDNRWVPLHRLLSDVYARYKRPLFIAETSHIGVGRGEWIRETAQEVCEARNQGVPIQGICLYPILDRHDWANTNHWHNSGLWDLALNGYNQYS